jgi:hypothetical protein
MRAAILAFVIGSWGLLCPDCLPQAKPLPSTTERAPQASNMEERAPAVQSLELKETISLAYSSPRVFGSGVKCDGSGNIFVPLPVSNPDGTLGSIVLLEILSDSKSTKTFGSQPLSASEYPNQWIKYFDVGPAGTVYALVGTHDDGKEGDKQPLAPQYFIERFNSDGSTDSVDHLNYPPGTGAVGLDLSHFGVFHDGTFILAGMQWDTSNGVEPFTAVYSSNGKFIRSVALPDDVPGDQTLKAQHASSGQRDAAISAIMLGSMVSSPDGNVYLLRNSQPGQLYGVDSSGEVVKHFQLSPPSPGLDVSSAGLAGEDSLLLYFGHPPPEHPGEKPISEWLVGLFNTVSGQFDAVYKLPTKGLRVAACSDQHGGLLYIGSTPDHHLAVFDYGP